MAQDKPCCRINPVAIPNPRGTNEQHNRHLGRSSGSRHDRPLLLPSDHSIECCRSGKTANFVTDYSGGPATDLHRFPFSSRPQRANREPKSECERLTHRRHFVKCLSKTKKNREIYTPYSRSFVCARNIGKSVSRISRSLSQSID